MDNTAKSRRFTLVRLLSLRSDQASHTDIDAAIRDNSRMAGTNLWVLMFAIIIASVGLNVNSTGVIIGAMLISPLMAPIIGIGYGAAVHDYAFIRQCFRNLLAFVGISLLASTLYFLLTPLKVAHSELFARTSPTLWDVLIAFFGGAAGMVGLTRKEKTTLIPGVAIATALMPPICTAGFGLATAQPEFFFGAFYLFLINAVFIALATLAIARVLRLPEHAFPDEAARRRGRALIGAAIAVTLLPSIYLAWQLVGNEVFTARAERFIAERLAAADAVVLVRREIDPGRRQITLTVLGRGATPEWKRELESHLRAAGLVDARLDVRQPAEDRIDVAALRAELRQDAQLGAARAGERNALRIAELERQLARFDAMNDALKDEMARLENELRAQLPGLRQVRVTERALTGAGGTSRPAVLVVIDSPKRLPPAELARLKRWLQARLPQAAGIEVVTARLDADPLPARAGK